MVEATRTAKKPEPMWRCQVKDCNFSTPPTLHGYNRIKGHLLKHSTEGVPKEEKVYRLVDQNTDEVLAKTLTEAREKGLLEPEPPPPEEKLGEKPEAIVGVLVPEVKAEAKVEPGAEEEKTEGKEEKTEGKEEKTEGKEEEVVGKGKEGKEITEPQVSPGGIFRYTVTLPADAFTLLNMAKAAGLEDADIPFDIWLWDCIRKRFEKDYKRQVVLAGIGEGEEYG